MKKVILLLLVLIICTGCVTTSKITFHNEKTTIVQCGDDFYQIPENMLVKIDLKNGTIEEIK